LYRGIDCESYNVEQVGYLARVQGDFGSNPNIVIKEKEIP
jgi:hypothetical protein